MTNFELYSLILNLIGLLFLGVTMLYAIKQLKILIKSHKDNHEWNRRIATKEALARQNTIDVEGLNEKFNYLDQKQPIPLNNIQKTFEEDIKLQNKCHKLLNFFEGIAAGIFFRNLR